MEKTLKELWLEKNNSGDSPSIDNKLDKIITFLEKNFGGSSKKRVEVVKAVDEQQYLAMFVVLEPGVEDAHGDLYSAETIEKACHSFSLHSNRANLLHSVETEKAKIVQNFVAPVEFEIESHEGNKEVISKGTWLQVWHFPPDDPDSLELWDLVKCGELCGLSVGCAGLAEELE